MRLIVSFLLLCSVCLAQGSFTVPVGKRPVQENTFNGAGKPFSRATGQSQQPKTIVDTVKIIAGFGSLDLSTKFSRTAHRTAATSNEKVYGTATAILRDSTKTVYSYSCVPVDNGARVIIKSSGGAADTGKVSVVVYVR